jgi:hypothetical protein
MARIPADLVTARLQIPSGPPKYTGSGTNLEGAMLRSDRRRRKPEETSKRLVVRYFNGVM